MIRTLQDHGIHQGIRVHMECTALELLQDGGRISGLLAYWRESGRFVLFKTKAVILATGGGGRCWRVTSNSWEYTGDGIAMAYDAGAELIDMEFTQFHPTGMVWPPSVRGTPERFAKETADTEEEAHRWLQGDQSARRPPELLTRDVVAKAITKEVQEGRGSPHGGVFLDIASRLPAETIQRKLPSMYHQFKELAEVDITKQPMEVGPTLHYFMGGIRVDADTQMSRVPGLFAAGECAGGMHGANRLGGNSLSDLLVFGWLAGKGAAAYIGGLKGAPAVQGADVDAGIRRATACLKRETGPNPYLLHERLQDILNDHCNIVRDAQGLEKGLEKHAALKPEVELVKAQGASQYNPGWHEAISLHSMMIASEAVMRGAQIREESRGGHTRVDFPSERDEWLKYNIIIS
jgi:succinate dehydrogenase / fumarate reductase flavoprotein subunit